MHFYHMHVSNFFVFHIQLFHLFASLWSVCHIFHVSYFSSPFQLWSYILLNVFRWCAVAGITLLRSSMLEYNKIIEVSARR